jgi:hypothetical protein
MDGNIDADRLKGGCPGEGMSRALRAARHDAAVAFPKSVVSVAKLMIIRLVAQPTRGRHCNRGPVGRAHAMPPARHARLHGDAARPQGERKGSSSRQKDCHTTTKE